MKDNLITGIFLFIISPIIIEFKFDSSIKIHISLLVTLMAMIVINIPSIFLYINYYLENRNTSFSIDYELKEIIINEKNKLKKYNFSEIVNSTYILSNYHKSKVDKKFRFKMLESDFCYWKIEFKNGDKFYLSNIIHEIDILKPFVPNTEYEYRFMQYIDKSNFKFNTEKSNSQENNFKNKKNEELEYIIDNPNKYQIKAINLAKKILLERKTLGNNG